MAKLVFGRPYYLASSHISYELVTAWSDGTFTVESEYGENFERSTLEEIENSHSHWGPPISHLIRTELLTDVHDECDFRWIFHPSEDGFYRVGKCPTCGQ